MELRAAFKWWNKTLSPSQSAAFLLTARTNQRAACTDRTGQRPLPAQISVFGTGTSSNGSSQEVYTPVWSERLTDGPPQRNTCRTSKWRVTSQTPLTAPPVPWWLGPAPVRSSPAGTSSWTRSWSGTRSGRCTSGSEPTSRVWWSPTPSTRCTCT